jgi:hypothetical protein
MTKEEYDELKRSMRARHEKEEFELAKQFALSNNKHEVGDVIEDHIGLGEIIKIQLDAYSKPPACVYLCKELTRKKEYKKNQSQRRIWQSNLKQ